MTNRLELNWKLDGFVDEQRYYCSETPIDVNALPAPKAVLSGQARSYVDTDGVLGKKYFIRVGAVKNGIEKISDESDVFFGKVWNPDYLSHKATHWVDETANTAISNNKVVSIDNINQSKNIVFSQSVDANRPLSTVHSSGFKSITFNGIDQRLQSASSLMLAEYRATPQAWCFIVMRKLTVDTSVINRNIFSNAPGNAGGGGRFSLGIGSSTANKLYLYSERVDGGSGSLVELNHVFNNTDTVIIFAQIDFNQAKSIATVNGNIIYDSSFGTSGLTSDTQAYWNAGIGAFIGYPPVVHCDMELLCLMQGGVSSGLQTESERQKLEGWAAHKYGLTANLPNDHPYKNLVPTI